MVRSGSRCKEGFVRVCTEIEEEINSIFKEYEEKTFKKVNKSKIMYQALKKASEEIKEEMSKV